MKNKFPTKICIGENFGWRQINFSEGFIYFKGHLNSRTSREEVIKLGYALLGAKHGRVSHLSEIDGHFACIVQTNSFIIAAVDRARTIPLLWALLPDKSFLIGDRAEPFLEKLPSAWKYLDQGAIKELALSGFVLGRNTIHSSVKGLLAGEILVISPSERRPKIFCYSMYRPWMLREGRAEKYWRNDLKEHTLAVLDKLIKRADGRQILVPLSAGLDSRLIISGLRHLGYKNVHSFSYGRPGNHEAAAAKEISSHLNYPWHFIPTRTKNVRTMRKSDDFQNFSILSDNLIATPVEQDVFTIMSLGQQTWSEPDGIIVNGQSGDFITGKHIPDSLAIELPDDRMAREKIILDAIIKKHFGLWSDLQTEENILKIKERIWDEFNEAKAPLDVQELSFSLYEFSEFLNRQSKYVLGNQRSYEVFGWDWHLPLWDKEYIDFWQKVPLKLKYKQKLYEDMLVEQNWGGVWNTLLPAPSWHTPSAIVPIRHLAHLFCVPFGEQVWKSIDKRFFGHITDPLRKYAAVSYSKVAFGAEHRNAVSWLTALYLERHGLNRRGESIG